MQGLISVRYRRTTSDEKSTIHLEIEDDGRGINIAQLREHLKAKGRVNVDSMADLDVAAQIFLGGMSSREEITELSGQGVGMPAVREEIMKIRGKIRIARTGPEGTLFEIELPDFSKSVKNPTVTSSASSAA